jgi:hypothetical protein
LASEKWLQQLTEVTKKLTLESRPDGKASTKVAIIDLDFQFEIQKPIEPPPSLHIVEIKGFSESGQGTQRHVTNRASIQADLISRVAPGAKLFIAHVQTDKSDSAGLDSQIAQVSPICVLHPR